MNEHIINKELHMTSEEAVAKGAKLFADAEAALARLASDMPKVFAAVRDGGNLGAIECMQLTASTGAKVNYALGTIAELHASLTEKAKEKNIDLPVPMSGGGR